MNKQQYLQQFKRSLRVAPKNIREDIIDDFEAILAAEDVQEDGLVERFGTPQELAEKYLEDSDVELPWYTLLMHFGRNLLLLIGVCALLVVLILYGLYAYYDDKRYFEYTNLQLAQTSSEFGQELRIATIPSSFAIEQAHVVLYSHTSPELLLRCRSEIEEKEKIRLQIQLERKNLVSLFRNACLVFVPEQSTLSLSVVQSEVNLIEPLANLRITGSQSSFALYSKNVQYRLEVEARQSIVHTLPQETNSPWRLSFDIYQSDLESYIPE